jgi:chromosomal replication initiation ATPase DnaA
MFSNRDLERVEAPNDRRRHGRIEAGREGVRAAFTVDDVATRCRRAAQLAASHYGLPIAEIITRRRGSRRATRARHVAMYLAHVVYGLNLAMIGAGFRRDRTTAAYACARIEDMRDEPAFDAALAGLEISAGILLDLDATGKAA